MSQDSSATAQTAHEETWREIEEVVQEVTRQSRVAVPAEEFFPGLLENSVRTMAATSGAVWMRHADGIRLEYQLNLASTGLVTSPTADDDSLIEQRSQQHLRLLHRVLGEATATAVSPQAGSNDAGLPENPTDFLLLLCPISIDERAVGIIEVFQRSNVSPGAVQGFLRFLTALAELAADFLRNSQLRDLQNRAALWSQFEQFTERLHTSLDVDRIAASIANDGRQLIGCDRVTVAVRRGSRFSVRSVSGLDSIDRRSNVVRAATDLIRRVVSTGEPFWYQDCSDQQAPSAGVEIAPQLDDAVHGYLDESPARLLAVFPLLSNAEIASQADCTGPTEIEDPKPVGAILVERFDGTETSSLLRHRCEVVARQSSLALRNALEYSSLPCLPMLRMVSRSAWYLQLRQLPRTALIVGILAAAVTALAIVPAEFTVEGHGELQPAVRRGVFASSDGVVADLAPALMSDESAAVSAGETLVRLANTDLEFELTRVLGEIRTAQESLRTKEVERLNVNDSDPDWESQLEKLSAEEKELEVRLASLKAQLDVLKQQQADLMVKSPIDGEILTWEAARILESRPVRRGDLLVEVADVDGPWILEIRVPDKNIGYVNEARRDLKKNLTVSFILATDPRTTRYGTIRDVASDTRSYGDAGPTVLVTVEIDSSEIPENQLRPGATVIPHIHTGKRPIGYVWFHELIHTIRTKLLF